MLNTGQLLFAFIVQTLVQLNGSEKFMSFVSVQATKMSLLTANLMGLLLCGPRVKVALGEAPSHDKT